MPVHPIVWKFIAEPEEKFGDHYSSLSYGNHVFDLMCRNGRSLFTYFLLNHTVGGFFHRHSDIVALLQESSSHVRLVEKV